jgi:hypothetical protein
MCRVCGDEEAFVGEKGPVINEFIDGSAMGASGILVDMTNGGWQR